MQNRIQGFGSTNYSSGGGSIGFSGGGGGSSEGMGGMLGSGLALGQSALNKAAGAVSNASSAVSKGMQVPQTVYATIKQPTRWSYIYVVLVFAQAPVSVDVLCSALAATLQHARVSCLLPLHQVFQLAPTFTIFRL